MTYLLTIPDSAGHSRITGYVPMSCEGRPRSQRSVPRQLGGMAATPPRSPNYCAAASALRSVRKVGSGLRAHDHQLRIA